MSTSMAKQMPERSEASVSRIPGVICGALFYTRIGRGDKDDEICTCSICNGEYSLCKRAYNPIKLPCGHVICRRCAHDCRVVGVLSEFIHRCPVKRCVVSMVYSKNIEADGHFVSILQDIATIGSKPTTSETTWSRNSTRGRWRVCQLLESCLPLKRVLVFGSAKAGKTSMLNCITMQQRATSDSAVGCTREPETRAVVVHDDTAYLFYDTAGLNEGDGGTVSSEDAAKGLVELVRNACSGFNLLVFVLERGEGITANMAGNYKAFVEVLAQNKVPCLAVVTRCENDPSLSYWTDKYASSFADRGMKFAEMVGACFKQTPENETLCIESAATVMAAIKRLSSQAPVVLKQDTVKAVLDKLMAILFPLLENSGIAKLMRQYKILWRTLTEESLFDEQRKSSTSS